MIEDTIFSPSFGNRPSYLVGREQVLSEVMQGLSTRPGSRERALVMLGQRGSGKTVLLWELAERASGAGYVVATPTVCSEGMLERIVEKVQDAGARGTGRLPRIAGASAGAFGFTVGLEFSSEIMESKSFEYKLTKLARILTEQGRGMLILVDELQANAVEVRKLVIAYQELVGEGLNVAMVLAGLPGAVSATLNDKVLTFLNRACRLELPPLATSDVEAYYARSFEALGVKLTRLQMDDAVGCVHGSPYMMQLIGHAVTMRAERNGSISADAMARALQLAQRDFENDVCETTIAALSDRDVDFLAAMAEDEGVSSIGAVATRMGVTPDYAQKYRKRLRDAGVIEQAGRGKVRFAVPYLQDYLRHER